MADAGGSGDGRRTADHRAAPRARRSTRAPGRLLDRPRVPDRGHRQRPMRSSGCAGSWPAAIGCTRPTRGTRDVGAVEAVGRGRGHAPSGRASGCRSRTSCLVPAPRPMRSSARSRSSMRPRHADDEVAFDVHTRLFGVHQSRGGAPPLGGRWRARRSSASVLASRRDELREPPQHRRQLRAARLRRWSSSSMHPAARGCAGRERRRPCRRGRPGSPRDVIYDVLAAHADAGRRPDVRSAGRTPVDQIATAAAHPLCSPSSDATSFSPAGPIGHSRLPRRLHLGAPGISRRSSASGGRCRSRPPSTA